MRRILLAALLTGLAPAVLPAPATATSAARFPVASERVSFSDGKDCVVRHLASSATRPAVLADMADGWSRERREALTRLLAAADAFIGAVAANEIDHGAGDACQLRAAEAAERRSFLHTLERVVAGGASDAAPLTFREADGALNSAYREVMAADDPRALAWGTVDKPGIRRAERAWLAYRDAFAAFAATLEQPGAAERVKIELTARRATSLEAFLAD